LKRHETPLRRVNPSGKTVWVARYTNRDGKRVSAGTFPLKRDAQDAIDRAYEEQHAPAGTVTVNSYFDGWLDRHPRSARTDVDYDQRIRYVLDVPLDGRPLRDWPLVAVKRRQAVDLLDHMLRVHGRAVSGARGILRVLSAMWQDAADDGHEVTNPFMGVKVRATDRRVRKPARVIVVWSWEQMREFCAAAALPVERDPMRVAPHMRESTMERWAQMNVWRAVYAEPMLRVLSDCGLRLGELLPLERADVYLDDGHCGMTGRCLMKGPHLHVVRTAWNGKVMAGTKTDHGEPYAGRSVPLGPSLADLLDGMPRRIDTRLLFPSVGGAMFWDRNFRRDVWGVARKRVPEMALARPHEFRHSYVSQMRAAKVDPEALARWSGHTVGTATAIYTHYVGGREDAGRAIVG
jgi:integrase